MTKLLKKKRKERREKSEMNSKIIAIHTSTGLMTSSTTAERPSKLKRDSLSSTNLAREVLERFTWLTTKRTSRMWL